MAKVRTAVVDERLMGLTGLLGEVRSGTAGAARGVDQQGRHQRGVDVMAHGVGDGQVQGVLVEGVVVGVAGDVGGRDQRAGEIELGGLAGGGRGQQLALGLHGQTDRGVRLPQWYRSVKRRSVTMMYASACAASSTCSSTSFVTWVRNSSSTPMVSPRLVTGASTRCPPHLPRRPHQLLGAQNLVVDTAAGQRDVLGTPLPRVPLVTHPQQTPAHFRIAPLASFEGRAEGGEAGNGRLLPPLELFMERVEPERHHARTCLRRPRLGSE